MKVLLVEDEKITREQLTKLLKGWGYKVIEASNGAEAVEILEKQQISLVVTDLVMPGIDGIELCRRIRSRRPGNYVYIIVVTGKGDQNSMFDAMFSGADDFIVKPWNNAEIRARLRTGERILHLEAELQDQISKLQNANHTILASNDRMKREIQYMGRIQGTLLPAKQACLRGVEVAWKHRPYSTLVGDGFNVFRLDENHIALYMLDVAGSGPASSFLLASLSRKLVPVPGQPGILKRLIKKDPGYEIALPDAVLASLNCSFPLDLDTSQYFTIFYAVVDMRNGAMIYATAGHPTPVVYNQDRGCRQLPGTGHPVGFVDDSKFDSYKYQLSAGDRLYLFSDGLSEVMNKASEPFGRKRLVEVIRHFSDDAPATAVDEVFRAGKDWSSSYSYADDVSILALVFNEF